MNAHLMAKTAYSSPRPALRTPRSIEYDAFAKVTARLKEATTQNGHGAFPALAAALHDNRQLWTMLASDVADSDNALPQHLRAQIFYLAEFTRLHSRKILSGDETTEPLIDINTAIMRGLSMNGAGS